MKPFWLRECLNAQLLVDDNFDIVRRDLIVQETGFSFYFIDGFIKDEVMEKMMESMKIEGETGTQELRDSMVFLDYCRSAIEKAITEKKNNLLQERK